jgi:adenylosuccinate synthase
MQKEADHLKARGIDDAWDRMYVDERAWIVTPYHRALNRIRELARGSNRHGSCGCGIGETVIDGLDTADPLTVWDLRNMLLFQEKLRLIKHRLAQRLAAIKDTISAIDSLALPTWIRDVQRRPFVIRRPLRSMGQDGQDLEFFGRPQPFKV